MAMFERYALGTVSARQLALETGFAATRIRMILMNPLYNGWVRRLRGPSETRKPAPWRRDPPVSDALWAQVTEVRRSKTRGGGPRRSGYVDLLGGLLECVCGRRIRSDGTFADGRHRKLHPDPCDAWGPKARLCNDTWETPINAQMAEIELDDATIASVVAALGSAERPVKLDRARLERQKRELALDHAAERLSDAAYLERLAHVRVEITALDAETRTTIASERIVDWLRTLGSTWLQTDQREEQAEVIHAVYERIVISGPTIVSARLTPAAYSHGLALVLPEVVRARPTGVERAITAYDMPIEGRDEWLAAVRRLA
ncbi:MAG: hypothetical protein ACRDGQ_10875 [Candidatus Limnocylindrales bacterium]